MGLMEINSKSMEVSEENTEKINVGEIESLEWTPDQEILLLYSLNGYKPVGPIKHFNMFVIQERLSNAMNKQISSKAIWKKLNAMYDLEALDEAEAETSALESVDIDFSLPEDEFGDLINAKLSGEVLTFKVENVDEAEKHENGGKEILTEIETSTNEEDVKDTQETPKRTGAERGPKKEVVKRGTKKKDSIPAKDNTTVKKENTKESYKKDSPNKSEVSKEPKKGTVKEEDKRESLKKTPQDVKRDVTKDDKKESPVKGNKRENVLKSSTEQMRKDLELKKPEQKKTPNQRGGAAQSRAETPKQPATDTKRVDAKNLRSETPKPVRIDQTKQQRLDVLRKDGNSDKKKESSDKLTDRKSPDAVRGSKLRTRERKTTEPEVTGKRERMKDSSIEEPPVKKAKIVITKSRPTRNSIEPQQKPASPLSSPQKRRARP